MISPKYDLCIYVLLSYELCIDIFIFHQKNIAFHSETHIKILYIRNQISVTIQFIPERVRTKVATHCYLPLIQHQYGNDSN